MMPENSRQELASSSVVPSEEITLKELVQKSRNLYRFLLSKWITILIVVAIGAILGFLYAQYKKPVYKAELSFALEEEKSGGLSSALGMASQFGIDLGGAGGGGAFTGGNLLSLMRSRAMVEKTLLTPIVVDGKTETLAELYISFNKLRENWEKKGLKNIQFPPNVDRSTFSRQQDSILGVFHKTLIDKNFTVDKLDKELSIIAIKVVSENEIFSQKFVEILARITSDFYVETKTKKSVQNVAILQHQTDSVRSELNSSISGVAFSMDVNPNANLARQRLKVPSQRRQVDVQANQAILTQLVTNLEVSKIALRKEAPLIQIIDSPILPLEKVSFGKLKGAILGGFLAGLLICLYLPIRRFFKGIMA